MASKPSGFTPKPLQESIVLSSGHSCQLIRVRNGWIPRYYLLAFPAAQGEPSADEIAEMMQLGTDRAKSLADQATGDPEAFGLIYSGYSARREKGWHIHIVLLGNRWRKAWLYLVLAAKNLLQALNLRADDAPRGGK